MNDDDIRPEDEKAQTAAALRSYQDETDGRTFGELLRVLGIPALATVFLVGGVYWIQLQAPAGSRGKQSTSIVQVQLLPRPDSVPIATAALPQPVTENIASRVDPSFKEPEPTISDDPLPVPRARTFAPEDAPPSNVMSAVSGPASSAAAKFQQTLLRHISRFQRYPSAAGPARLVDTQFAIARDGTLLGVWVRTSSGQMLLDKEAIETIRRAQPLPPIPPELPDRLNIQMQLEFDPS